MQPMRGKYRMRTWLRRRLPWAVSARIPKGRDCGAHAWYRSDETTWRCYHCEAGVTNQSPWEPIDTAVGSMETIRLLLEHPEALDESDVPEIHRLVREAHQGLERALADTGIPMPQDEPEVEQPAEPARPVAAQAKRARTPAQPVPRASH